MCWTMCMTNSWSASASTGEISADATSARPAHERRQPPPARRSRALLAGGLRSSATGRAPPASAIRTIGPGSSVHDRSVAITPPSCRTARATRHTAFARRLRRCGVIALSLLVPPSCCACGAQTGGDVLCAACRRALPWLIGSRCERCGLPGRCARAAVRPPAPPSRAAWAPVAHAGPRARARRRAEVPRRTARRRRDGGADRRRAPRAVCSTASLVPVPSHRALRMARGFDHADCLARALARRTGLPTSRCVRRAGRPTRQLGSGRAARLSAGRAAAVIVTSRAAARGARRRRPHHGGDARRLRTRPAGRRLWRCRCADLLAHAALTILIPHSQSRTIVVTHSHNRGEPNAD